MTVLIDTHVFLWYCLGTDKLSAPAAAVLDDLANTILVSPATFWEIAIKVSIGKLVLSAPYDEFMVRGIVGNEFEILPVELWHTARLVALPHHHRDPFDRMLAAQALVEDIPFLSADAAFDPYGVTRLW